MALSSLASNELIYHKLQR